MSLSEHVQMDADLTLEKAKKLVRQREAVKEHKELLGDIDKQPMVEQIRHKPFWRSRTANSHPNQKNKNAQSMQAKCKRCGNKPYPNSKCLAKDSLCHKYKRKGHYNSQCFSKTVNEITEQMEAEHLDVSYLSTIGTDNDSSWNATIQINGQSEVFKLDTGAEVTAITEPTLTKLGNVQLRPAAKSLCGPDKKPLKVMGPLTTELAYTNSKCRHDVYVIEHLKHNLLGLPSFRELNLLTQVDYIESNHCQVVNKFLKLFTGLGTFKGDFEITIQPEAKPLVCNIHSM